MLKAGLSLYNKITYYNKEEKNMVNNIPDKETVTRINLEPEFDDKSNIALDKRSLIPIKGIDDERKKILENLNIFSSDDLLCHGRTIAQRKQIATEIKKAEKGVLKDPDNDLRWQKAYECYVAAWVKQVDLWRINNMDVNTAYFLMELGIRHVEDFVKIDVNKTYPMMQCLANSHPEYTLISLETLTLLVSNASKLSTRYPVYQNILKEKIQDSLSNTKIEFKRKKAYSNQKLTSVKISDIFDSLSEKLSKLNIEDIFGGSSLECDDPAPTFLFRDEFIKGVDIKTDTNKNIEIIRRGIDFLNDIEMVLPLPKKIKGTVYLVETGEVLPEAIDKRRDYALCNAKVEIDGIASPTEDKGEDNENPHGFTDGNGNFIIKLPEKYNMQESLTFIISQDLKKQKFVINASDIVDHVEKQKIITAFNQLDLIHQDIKENRAKLSIIDEINNKKASNEIISFDEETRYNLYLEQPNDISNEIVELEEQALKLETIIKSSDPTTNNLERIMRNLMASDNLVSNFTEEPFIINKDIFNAYQNNYQKVLPSVKLMEKDNQSIYLPTDTAPSQVFNYSFLQRLVEPEISPFANEKEKKPRIKLTEHIDVTDFKNKLATNPNKLPQMSSLGIGYNLNMHQAWIPDGFALGNLLYSLVLAPGEEQRLIVREKKQNYQITDSAEGNDSIAQNYTTSQIDNTTATYEYALNQLSQAHSNYSFSTTTKSRSAGASIGGLFSGISASLGLSGSVSKTTGKGASAASQSNAHNEASQAAQGFQHNIKTASEKISQAQRVSISMATGEDTDSVATKIIANHNHSHAMTIQYWEVMRRYRLETCVDSIDLVLFIPLKTINFLNGKDYLLNSDEWQQKNYDYRKEFNSRYEILLKYADVLELGLPYKYKTGLNLIKYYSSLPDWKIEPTNLSNKQLTLSFSGIFLSFDDITATLILKNGKGIIAGKTTYERYTLKKTFETSYELKNAIRSIRNNIDIKKYTNAKNDNLQTFTCIFELPYNVTDEDISYIRINHSCEALNYVLYKDINATSKDENNANKTYQEMIDKMWDLAKDNKKSDIDIKKINYYESILPEAWIHPNIILNSQTLKSLGQPIISDLCLKDALNNVIKVTCPNDKLSSSTNIDISIDKQTLQYSELQKIEETLHHVASNTMNYSQLIWSTLTQDERAIMLERYTIGMDFKDLNTNEEDDFDDIPLLNCINVRKLLGFYGNCMLFPFTYPQKLADKLGKTAAELQDSLYRYHTNYFRVPSTTISLPTEGMIGEAVLGATNVSEKIDLTRFWNWKDSPIDSMSIDSSYLNNTDYLANKTTKDITALNIQGVTPTTPVTNVDLISALVNKKTPEFNNITGLDQLKDILNNGVNSASDGRNKALSAINELTKTTLDKALEGAKLDLEKYKLDKKSDSSNISKDDSSTDNSSDEDNNFTEDNSSTDNSSDEDNNFTEDNNFIEDSDYTENNFTPTDTELDISNLDSIIDGALDVLGTNSKISPKDLYNLLTGANISNEDLDKLFKEFETKYGISINEGD